MQKVAIKTGMNLYVNAGDYATNLDTYTGKPQMVILDSAFALTMTGAIAVLAATAFWNAELNKLVTIQFTEHTLINLLSIL